VCAAPEVKELYTFAFQDCDCGHSLIVVHRERERDGEKFENAAKKAGQVAGDEWDEMTSQFIFAVA